MRVLGFSVIRLILHRPVEDFPSLGKRKKEERERKGEGAEL